MKYFVCKTCGKIIEIVKDTDVPTICCGEPMKAMESGMTDGATEKHIPVIKVDGCTVKVTIGEIDHPMVEEHHIEWVAIKTKQGWQRKALKVGEKPRVCFALTKDDEIVAAYEYCSVHGLWKKEV